MVDVYEEDYGFDDDDYGYEDCGNDSDNSESAADCSDLECPLETEKTYTVLQEDDIRKRLEEEILHVKSTLFVLEGSARKLLHHYKWNVSQLHDEWFADEERVRAKVGLLSSEVPVQNTEELVTCGICFDSFPSHAEEIYHTICGHPYCVTCLRGYITAAINNGPGCLSLRCPEPTCRAVIVDQDVIDQLASEEEKEKFAKYYVRSYVEQNKKIKWCPAPDCENAVEFEIGSDVCDVTCLCSHAFCWNCAEEVHRPVDCETVAKWVLKNSSESENAAWIIANSKPCPKCKRSIEKDLGCMHMTCGDPCKFEFCWLCLGEWKSHNDKTGGYYACNIYQTEKAKGSYDEEENKRQLAKITSDKYNHYYERWASNEKSRQKATESLQVMQTTTLHELSHDFNEPVTQLEYIVDAWEQIIECRRVLKWTYAYGYYLPEDEVVKKQFFEFLQGDAESHLERLHHCAENNLSVFQRAKETASQKANDKKTDEEVKPEDKEEAFRNFRPKLTNLTTVTRNHFEKLVRSLESGLSEVVAQGAHNAAPQSACKKGSGKSGRRKHK